MLVVVVVVVVVVVGMGVVEAVDGGGEGGLAAREEAPCTPAVVGASLPPHASRRVGVQA